MYKPFVAFLVAQHDAAKRHQRARYLRAIVSETGEKRPSEALRIARRVLAHDTDPEVARIRRFRKTELAEQARRQNVINRRHATQDMSSTGSPNLR